MSTRLLQHPLKSMALKPPLLKTNQSTNSFLLQKPSNSRNLHHTTQPSQLSPPTPTSKTNTNGPNPTLPSFNLFTQIREARPAVRYTVYAGIGLMATVELTFWFNVIKAKFFPSTEVDEKAKTEQFLENVKIAIKSYRAEYLGNYRRYYGSYMWGAGER